MSLIQAIGENVINGDASKVKELVQEALAEGESIKAILSQGLIATMAVVGENFKREEIYLPEVLFAARAMKAGMEVLQPVMLKGGVEPLAKIVLGSVKGDIHDIGKKLVDIMLEGAGFEVIDLGIDVPPERFVDAAQKHKVKLVGMSALTGATMPFMKTTIEALEVAGLGGKVKTLVGGAIVTQGYANKIGADGYASNAVLAVDKAKELLGLR